jgi:hypothetical protein
MVVVGWVSGCGCMARGVMYIFSLLDVLPRGCVDLLLQVLGVWDTPSQVGVATGLCRVFCCHCSGLVGSRRLCPQLKIVFALKEGVEGVVGGCWSCGLFVFTEEEYGIVQKMI